MPEEKQRSVTQVAIKDTELLRVRVAGHHGIYKHFYEQKQGNAAHLSVASNI
jgi:hypothetical protein